jgi:hypothetical protein
MEDEGQMNEKSTTERVMMILGIIFGFVIWVGGLVVALLRTLWKTIGGEPVSRGGDSAGVADRAKQAVSDVKQRAGDLLKSDEGQAATEPEMPAGEAAVVEGLTSREDDLHHLQHQDLGGIPGGTGGRLSAASAYSAGQSPHDADISTDGVELNYTDDTDRGRDVRLDEGIPNLGEPGDIEEAGPATASEEAVVEEVETGVPEQYGQVDELDSVTNDVPWVADAPGESDDVPAASRGYREYGEAGDDAEEIGDMSDTDDLGLLDDVDPYGAGGEVDLQNDEAPSWDDSGMSIVDDPNEALAADAAGPLDNEETLGLRDSESPGVNEDLVLEDPSDITAGSGHLGVTGDYDQADTTERIPAMQGEPGPDTEEGSALRESFTTGDDDTEDVDRITGVDTEDSGNFGRTDELGVPAGDVDGNNLSVGVPGLEDAPAEHLGVSGDFDKADSTETVPAVPTGDETAVDSDISRESFVTGDEANQSDDSDTTENRSGSSGGRGSGDAAGYSAAWSTPAGVVGRSPDEADGTTGFEDLTAPGASDTSAGAGAGSGDADTRSGGSGSFFLDEYSGGDPADLAAAAVGDLGTATSTSMYSASSVEHEEGITADGGTAVSRTTVSAGHAREEESSSRKSRKQRKQQSDWVPQGAVRGDGNPTCPADFPIKGNANSRIYHRPADPSYAPTIPEFCFSSEEDAKKAGFRAPRG